MEMSNQKYFTRIIQLIKIIMRIKVGLINLDY